MTKLVPLVGLLISAGSVSLAAGDVVSVSVTADTFASSLSGRNGSVDGPHEDNPPPVGGMLTCTGGSAASIASSQSGPVPPAFPPTPSFPGTTGVADGLCNASASVVHTETTTTITAQIQAANGFAGMDGGGYAGTGVGELSVDFTLTAPATYALTGTLAWDDEDNGGSLSIVGANVFLFNLFNGPVVRVGTLSPGTYSLRANAAAGQTWAPGVGSSSETSGLNVVLTISAGGPACPVCDSLDFNNDGNIEPLDVDAYFSVLGEGPCLGDIGNGCNDLDFNNDGNIEPRDVDAYFSVLGEGPCF